METNCISKRYATRSKARSEKPVAKSRVDWRRTRRSRLLESEEEDDDATSTSEKETSSEDDNEQEERGGESAACRSENEVGVNENILPGAELACDNSAAEDAEEENVALGKRKRSRCSVMYDSNESEDSDIVRKVYAKRSCIIDDEDSQVGQELCTSPAEEAASRKQKRCIKLQELSERQSTRRRSTSQLQENTDDDVQTIEDVWLSPLTPADSDTSEGDSMKDFIDDDDADEGEESELGEPGEDESQKPDMAKLLLENYIPHLSRVDHYVHFQRVIKAFLINAIDNTFLISLYGGERQKKYAQDMMTSLHYLDNRFIQPRLDNLLARSRWKDRYRERVDSYHAVRIILCNPVQRSCQACELQRYCKFTVSLSGKSYDSNTLEVDNFMSHDKQVLKVGSVCGNRTQIYHILKHFKFNLYQDCCLAIENERFQNEPVKDSVDRVFNQLDEDGWIHQHYADLQGYMDNADYFQEEKMD